MSKSIKQPAQAQKKPSKVEVSGFPTEFYPELQRLIREGYTVVLEGGEAPQTMMNQWSHAVLVLPETA